uniref:WAT1-related protein n=1 Tax=Oryza meridionalis TaxID=40149 RepID=A0A0E0DQE4_9ORYZ
MASPARTGEAAVVVVGVAEQEAAVVEERREEEEQAAAGVAAVLLPVGMVMVQVFTAVTLLLSELALGAGAARPLVLLVYRNLVGAAAVAPLAVLFERGMMKKMNAVVCGWISINATFGVLLATGMYYYGLRDTNAAYSANFLNLIPIVTFIIAVIFRAEKLAIASWAGRMKVLGTVLSVSGTMVVSLFRGQLLHLWPTHLLRLGSHAAAAAPPSSPAGTTISGTLLLCGSCLNYALWFIVQAKLAKVFPSKYWATVLTCLSGSLQALVAGVLTTGDWSEWKISWDLRLLAVAYSGVFNTGITFVLISWAITRRGPIYPSMFNSLSLIITTVMDSLLLGANIYLGSVIGALLIIVGLYAFLWGKGKELQLKAAQGVPKQEERHKAAGDDDPEI